MSGFNKPIGDLLNKNDKADIQMQLFNKEECADMKLDFFESDISHLTDDKSSKNLSLPKSMHAITSSNSTISPSTADLNFKIASVKKVWDNTMMPPVLEHNIGQEDSNTSFSTSFGPDPNSLDASSAFSKGTDTSDDAHEGYSSSPNQNVPNSTTNVCKVSFTVYLLLYHRINVKIFRLNPLSKYQVQPDKMSALTNNILALLVLD